MTGRLAELAVGDIIGLEGPAGHMIFKNELKAAFIAGGTGIAPFMSMLRHAADEGLDGEFILFYSTKTESHILYREELAGLSSRNPGIKIVITLTREAPPGWKGETGRIESGMLARHARDPGAFDWWVCGPPLMVKAVRESLFALSVDPRRLRLEGW